MKVSQIAIAKQLGISPATVSRALRNDQRIKPETRHRIIEAANKIKLKSKNERLASFSAEGFAANGISEVGVLAVGTETHLLPQNMVQHRYLNGMGRLSRSCLTLLKLEQIDPANASRLHEPECQPLIVQEGRVRGLILIGHYGTESLRWLSSRLPCVWLVEHSRELFLDCVDQDHAGAVFQHVQHLLSLGHQKIGFVSTGDDRSNYLARFAGYVLALTENGITYDPRHAIAVLGGHRDMEEITGEVLARIREGVRAWILVHDGLGYELITRLKDKGFNVPEDVSLCGFDNLTPPAGLPKLTSMEFPFEEIGVTGLRRLVERISDPTLTPIHTLFQGAFVAGKSTAPLT